MVEGQWPVRLIVGQVGEEGEVEVAGEQSADVRAKLYFIDLDIDVDLAPAIDNDLRDVVKDVDAGQARNLHQGGESARVAGIGHELLCPRDVESVELAEAFLAERPLDLRPLDRTAVVAVA